MADKKFLTVMAVFDSETQEKLAKIQSEIIDRVGEGTQTMGIPFHLTLGSYPTDAEAEVVERISRVASSIKQFEVLLEKYDCFGERVLFLKPNIPEELFALRKNFQCDYANGFDWMPHATLFCGEGDELERARAILPKIDEPIKTKIVGIELGEFFPPKKIIRTDFKK